MFIECIVKQINKYGEELCGDNVEVVRNPDNTVIVLSDGLGSGVKANILSTLTKKIASTMLSNGMEIEEVVETLIETLPICQSRKIAYSTFTILQIFNNDEVKLVEFDNPDTFYIHEGKLTSLEACKTTISGKNLKISKFKISKGDFIIMASDGLIHAGLGGLIKLGWGWDKVANFIQRNAQDEINAETLADKLIFIANELYQGRTGDDTSVVVVKIREKRNLTIAVGPPKDKENDQKLVENFMKTSGRKVICGGTTANIIAKALNKEIKVILNNNKDNVPPKGEIEGVDLVTEGVITLSKVVEVFENVRNKTGRHDNSRLQNIKAIYSSGDATQTVLDNPLCKTVFQPENPAEELALELHTADSIKFIVGKAINPAHQNPDFPVQSSLKHKLIYELKDKLEKQNKEVIIEYS